jgi:hypothetical protein
MTTIDEIILGVRTAQMLDGDDSESVPALMGRLCDEVETLRQQLATARQSAFEEAAGITDLWSTQFGGEPLNMNERQIVEHIIAKIREKAKGVTLQLADHVPYQPRVLAQVRIVGVNHSC